MLQALNIWGAPPPALAHSLLFYYGALWIAPPIYYTDAFFGAMHRHRQTRRFGGVPFFMVLCNPPNGDRRLGVLGDILATPLCCEAAATAGTLVWLADWHQQMFEAAVNKLTFLERGLWGFS